MLCPEGLDLSIHNLAATDDNVDEARDCQGQASTLKNARHRYYCI